MASLETLHHLNSGNCSAIAAFPIHTAMASGAWGMTYAQALLAVRHRRRLWPAVSVIDILRNV
eukprot:3538061-Amphidinium_carterae.2